MENEVRKTEQTEKLDAIRKQTHIFIPLAWVFVFLGFMAAYFGYQAVVKKGGGFTLDNLASYGSFLQGSVASLWSLAGLFFIYIAFLGQREQLIKQDEELEDQQAQFQLQHESIKRQNFESAFFQLLNLHNQNVSQMRRVRYARNATNLAPTEYVNEGRACFEEMYKLFKSHYSDEARILHKSHEVIAVDAYLSFYSGHQGALGHYFRTLYHVIKFVNTSAIEDKRRYTSLARAQLSQFELALLFYNGICPLGEKFKPLIEEFGLLENLDEALLLHPEHEKLYNPKAFE